MRETETHCRRCGDEIDWTLPYKDPITGEVNVWYGTYGHLDELDAGGHPYHGRAEHLHCNSSAGATYGNAKRNATNEPLSTSPDWT
ncbi:MAG TPA: hypothetical protein VGC45_15705 [Gryllotalpicola sp.]